MVELNDFLEEKNLLCNYILYIDPGFNMLGLQISDYNFGQMFCQVNRNLGVGQIQFNSITNAPQQHFRQCSVALQLENILIFS